LTFATTYEAMIGAESKLSEFLERVTGSTLSTLPPVFSASLHKESRLHSSPIIEITFTETPLLLAYSPTFS